MKLVKAFVIFFVLSLCAELMFAASYLHTVHNDFGAGLVRLASELIFILLFVVPLLRMFSKKRKKANRDSHEEIAKKYKYR